MKFFERLVFLTFVIMLWTTLGNTIFAKEQAFDVQSFPGGNVNAEGAAYSNWGVYGITDPVGATGTRYIFEIEREEVGGKNSYKYYINNIEDKNGKDTLVMGAMYHNDSMDYGGFYVTKEITNFSSNTMKTVTSPPSNTGNWFNRWRSENIERPSLNDEGIQFLARIIAARAYELGDKETYNQMKSIADWTFTGEIEIKAEILFRLKPPKTNNSIWLTYIETKEVANDGEHGSGYGWIRGGGYTVKQNGRDVYQVGGELDKIACKLYEKDKKFSLNKNGTVNCSCNYLTKYSSGNWKLNSSDGRWLLSISGYGGNNLTIPEVGRVFPNVCSIAVNGKYYSMGLKNKYDGLLVRGSISVNGTTVTGPAWARYADNYMDYTTLKANSPTIYEGWDYIFEEQIEPQGRIVVNEILVYANGSTKVLDSNTESVLYNVNQTYKPTDRAKQNYEYYGYTTEYALVSNGIYDNYKTGNKVTVRATESRPSVIVNFLYNDENLSPMNVAVEIIHTDASTGKRIIPKDEVLRNYDDITDLVEVLVSDRNSIAAMSYDYNAVATNRKMTYKQKLDYVFEILRDMGVWQTSQKETIKSLNVASGGAYEQYSNRYVEVGSTGINRTVTGNAIVKKEQYIPNADDIIQAIPSNINKKLIINFVYDVKYTVTVNYVDTNRNPIHDSKVYEAEHNETITETPITIPGYTYIKSEPSSINGKITKKVNEDIVITYIYQTKPIITGNITLNPEAKPNNQSTKYTDNQIIILDELFDLNIKIDNFLSTEVGSITKVTFPFDVYYNNEFVQAGDVINLENLSTEGKTNSENFVYTFRLPSWVLEKDYNGTNGNGLVHIFIQKGNEIVTEQNTSILVIGRLYDFTVTNLEGDSEWNQFLFKGENLNKEYKANLLPIGQSKAGNINIQNATYNYGIKLGSSFLFSINTKGLKSDSIRIIPKVVYIDKEGNINSDAKLYYMVAGKGETAFDIASTINSNNFVTTLNKQTRLTEEVRGELTKGITLLRYGANISTKVKNAYASFNATSSKSFGNYNKLTLPNTLRTPFVNYIFKEAPTIASLNYTSLSYTQEYKFRANELMTDDEIVNSVGHWYAEYKLPSSLYAKDSKGNKLSNDGYYMVLFNIVSLDDTSSKEVYLSYTQPNGNTQWQKENGNQNTITINLPRLANQATNKTLQINLNSSEYKNYYPIAIYQAGLSLNNDYEISATH